MNKTFTVMTVVFEASILTITRKPGIIRYQCVTCPRQHVEQGRFPHIWSADQRHDRLQLTGLLIILLHGHPAQKSRSSSLFRIWNV